MCFRVCPTSVPLSQGLPSYNDEHIALLFITAGTALPVVPRCTQKHIHTNVISRVAGVAHTSDSKLKTTVRADEHAFKLSRAILVTKLSRLELEQHRRPDLSAVQLERVIRERGTDYDSLLYHHHVHNNFLERVADCFSEAGVDVRIANR